MPAENPEVSPDVVTPKPTEGKIEPLKPESISDKFPPQALPHSTHPLIGEDPIKVAIERKGSEAIYTDKEAEALGQAKLAHLRQAEQGVEASGPKVTKPEPFSSIEEILRRAEEARKAGFDPSNPEESTKAEARIREEAKGFIPKPTEIAAFDFGRIVEGRAEIEGNKEIREAAIRHAVTRIRDLDALPVREKYSSRIRVGDRDIPELIYYRERFARLIEQKLEDSEREDQLNSVEVVEEAGRRETREPMDVGTAERPEVIYRRYQEAETTEERRRQGEMLGEYFEEGIARKWIKNERLLGIYQDLFLALNSGDEELMRRVVTEFEVLERGADQLSSSLERVARDRVEDPAYRDAISRGLRGERLIEVRDRDDAPWRSHDLGKMASAIRLYYERANLNISELMSGQIPETLTNREQLPGEIDIMRAASGEANDRHTYFESVSGYYRVTATTEEQFRVSSEKFMEIVKNGAFGRKADAIFSQMQRYVEAFVQRGQEIAALKSLKEREAFIASIIKSRLQMEAQVYIYTRSYGVDQYDGALIGSADDAMGSDSEAKRRWLSIADLYEGEMMAVLRLKDFDPRMRAYFQAPGGRGEWMGNHDIQAVYQGYWEKQFIKRIMRIKIKDYLPGHEHEYTPAQREAAKKANISRVGNHLSEHDFRSLYEGMRDDFWDDAVYERFVDEAQRKRDLGRKRDILAKEARGEILTPEEDALLDRMGDAPLTDDEIRLIEGNPLTSYELRAVRMREDSDYYAQEEARAKAVFTLSKEVYDATGELGVRAAPCVVVKRREVRRNERGEVMRDHEGHVLFEEDEITELIPVTEMQNFVQFMVTYTRKKCSEDGMSAAEIDDEVYKAQTIAIAMLFTQGYSAVPVDPRTVEVDDHFVPVPGTGERIKIGKKRKDPVTGEYVAYDPDTRKPLVELVDAEFDDVLTHPYGMWISHTYADTQEEIRHQLLSPAVLEARDRILDGVSTAEDEDPLATQAVILDPGRRILKKLPGNQTAEDIITASAFEAVYQYHWDLDSAILKAALSQSGTNLDDLRLYYGQQDYGGWNKLAMNFKYFAAVNMKEVNRRGIELTWTLPVTYSGIARQMGARGASGFFGIMNRRNASAKDILTETIGNFSLARYAGMTKTMSRIMDTLVGFVDMNSFTHTEGWLEKPLNTSWTIQKFFNQLKGISGHPIEHAPENEVGFLQGVLETWGRYIKFCQAVVLFEHFRKSRRALDLRRTDPYTNFATGEVRPGLVTNADTGSSRHMLKKLYIEFRSWLRSAAPRQGAFYYPSERMFYEALDEPLALGHMSGDHHGGTRDDRLESHIDR